MALHTWLREQWDEDSDSKEEGWKSEFGQLDQFQLAQGLIPSGVHPDRPRPNMKAIDAAASEVIADVVNDPYWEQSDSASTIPEAPSDAEIFNTAAEYVTPKAARDWRQKIADEEHIRAAARAEVEQPSYAYDASPITSQQREEYELEAQAGEDEWQFDEPDEFNDE